MEARTGDEISNRDGLVPHPADGRGAGARAVTVHFEPRECAACGCAMSSRARWTRSRWPERGGACAHGRSVDDHLFRGLRRDAGRLCRVQPVAVGPVGQLSRSTAIGRACGLPTRSAIVAGLDGAADMVALEAHDRAAGRCAPARRCRPSSRPTTAP